MKTKKNTKIGRPVYWTDAKKEELLKKFKKWMEDPKHIWFNDFIYDNKLRLETFYKIAKEYEPFSEAIELAKLKQENFLVKGGLFNKTHPGFTMFLLKTNYKDKYKTADESEKGVVVKVYSKKISDEEECDTVG